MKRTISAKLVILWILALTPLVITAIAYRKLPDQIPMHWDFNGIVSTGPKWNIWIISFMSVLMTAFMFIVPRIDPRKDNYNRFSGAYEMFLIIFNLFMLVMNLCILTETLRPSTLNMQVVVMVLVGILFAVLGNLMPKFKHNYFIGIRTPWTLASETVWYRTHRICGPLWVVGGLVIILCAFLPATAAFAILTVDILLICIVPYVMSYVWFKQEQ